MKKSIITIIFLLFVVIDALAWHISVELLDVSRTGPKINGNRYTDYDITSNHFGSSKEIFCVERSKPHIGVSLYDIYTIDNTSYYGKNGKNITVKKAAQLKKASWFANWYLNISDGTDNEKAIAQIAIWDALEAIGTYNGPFAADIAHLMYQYIIATDKDAYINDWAVAVSPGDGSPIVWNEVGQNFLIHINSPEVTTFIYFCMGLLSLSWIGRRKYFKL
jgi:hypothetical protein